MKITYLGEHYIRHELDCMAGMFVISDYVTTDEWKGHFAHPDLRNALITTF